MQKKGCTENWQRRGIISDPVIEPMFYREGITKAQFHYSCHNNFSILTAERGATREILRVGDTNFGLNTAHVSVQYVKNSM